MESPFTYNSQATGLYFISRKKELNQTISFIKEKKNLIIYEPPRTGKRSLVLHSFSVLEKNGYKPLLCRMDLMNVTDMYSMLKLMEKRLCALSPVGPLSSEGLCITEERLSEVPSKEEIQRVFSLPARLSETAGSPVVVWIEEFHNIMKFDEWDKMLNIMEKCMDSQEGISFILTGSGVNAMKYLFEERKYLYHKVERVRFLPMEEKAVTDTIIKVFLRVGRVVEQSHAERIYETVDGHPWYVWQISNISFNLTKGYMNDGLIDYAIDSLLSLHDTRFRALVDDLSRYQILFLKAIFDGETKLSSSETIARYGLNSSANVHRLKEALMKKEVAAFDEYDIPYIIDPLFKLWLRRFYFVD